MRLQVESRTYEPCERRAVIQKVLPEGWKRNKGASPSFLWQLCGPSGLRICKAWKLLTVYALADLTDSGRGNPFLAPGRPSRTSHAHTR